MDMDIDPEASPGPGRCDSSLSVIKITPATRKKKGFLPVVTQKFSDPEIEELYQLHSTNRKRTELFRCFLYALLFYCVAQVVLNSFWLTYRDPHQYHTDPQQMPNKGVKGLIRGPIHVSILKPHDVTHELDKSRLTSGTVGDQPHQHHPTSLHHEVAARHANHASNPSPGPLDPSGIHPAQNPKHYPPKQNPSFMSHQQHPALGQGGTRPSKPGLVHPPADHPFFHFSSLNSTTARAKRATASKLFGKAIEAYQQEFNLNHRTDEGDKIFMVTSFVFLGATMVVTLFMLISPGTCRGNAHIPVLLWSSNILVSIVLRSEDSSLPLRLGLGWVLLEIFLIWVTLPIRFRTALVYSSLLTAIHSGVVLWRGKRQPLLGPQLGANLILLVTTNVLGILSFYLSDKKQRRAFLDTRQSLEMKLVIEEQAKEQERLLLSVLPEHLALKMRQDLGEATDGQFKKIYMARHENVSILYADIVGFTAISSTYSASELVKILNELFARFDRLSDKYSQIRIKILGDCYYCICGAPEERKDHAVLSVHMGLSMVKAIKYVRETTNSPVDMRVGIHTGAILAGVLGQRQWQFDVYSKDVELANKMESSGMPGRVHISDKTLSFLTDEFEVEPAFGERREEILRIAGLKTYFITRVVKPFHENSASKMISENGEVQEDNTIVKDFPSDLNSTFAEDSTSAVEDNGTARKDSELESYRLRLKEELISRDGYRDLAKQSKWFTLQFLDGRKEAQFVIYKEPYAGISSLACPIALVAFSLATFFVISFNLIALTTAILALIILLSISVISAYETSSIKSRLKKTSNSLGFLCSLDSKLWVRRLLAILTILLLTTVNAIFMIPCMETGSQCSNMTYPQLVDYSAMEPMTPLVLPTTTLTFSSLGCRYPAYLILFCSFFLFSVTLLAQPGSWLKSFAIFLVLLAHALLINFEPLQMAFECSEKFSFSGSDLIPENWQLTIFIVVIFFVLFTLNRRLEKSSRVLFLWKTEVEQQREHATQLRQKNEALVYNILPQHVASHFLGNRKRKHEELYSQSYSQVGILFASMPNFSDFYSEESVNNQGLECLRFLNEVISDFDGILELPRFADHIIKIKTISSTYMAASGLNPSKQTRPEDPLKQRWAHLSLLVEFALEMKIILTGINEQSFNHFVLKMGINHGPITAGVIGARKPHYDIWGNSVNVASRMESTGKAGCIQVTEETYRILKVFGYQFEQRGLVNVKGKGQLMTYYLTGRGPELSNQEVDELLDQYAKEALQSTPLEVNQANNKK